MKILGIENNFEFFSFEVPPTLRTANEYLSIFPSSKNNLLSPMKIKKSRQRAHQNDVMGEEAGRVKQNSSKCPRKILHLYSTSQSLLQSRLADTYYMLVTRNQPLPKMNF